mgnify:CR=1 FL=1
MSNGMEDTAAKIRKKRIRIWCLTIITAQTPIRLKKSE